MKSLTLSLIVFLGVALLGNDSSAESLPEFRPALIGFHNRSLVNLIKTDALMKHGQKDAVLMFSCGVDEMGNAGGARTYRESPNANLLRDEVMARINQAQFAPAVYHHFHVPVYISGTVNFFIRDGKPHLRIYLNQEEHDLMKGQDFVAPQFACIPGNARFKGIFYPPQAPGHPGVASVRLTVDATGKVRGAKTVYEYPPNMHYGAETAGGIMDAAFIPGFRNGKPGPCEFTWSLIFGGPTRRQIKTG